MIYLLIALPLASVVMGAITFYVAFSDADPVVLKSEQALSKTSWRDETVEQVTPP